MTIYKQYKEKYKNSKKKKLLTIEDKLNRLKKIVNKKLKVKIRHKVNKVQALMNKKYNKLNK